MRKVAIALLLAASLFADVAELLPDGVYHKNRAIVQAIAAKGGGLVRQLQLLERAGVMREAFGVSGGRTIYMRASQKPLLLMHLGQRALEQAGVFTYHLKSLASSGYGITQTFEIGRQEAPQLSRLVAYLQRHGVSVRRLVFSGGWRIDLDLSGARADAKRANGVAHFDVPKEGLWLDVCGAVQVSLAAGGGRWYPKVFIYDDDLEPLERYIAQSAAHTITLSLPNGACYIKISDRFTPKNLKRGLRVKVR